MALAPATAPAGEQRPNILLDLAAMRSDLADYALEMEWADAMVFRRCADSGAFDDLRRRLILLCPNNHG